LAWSEFMISSVVSECSWAFAVACQPTKSSAAITAHEMHLPAILSTSPQLPRLANLTAELGVALSRQRLTGLVALLAFTCALLLVLSEARAATITATHTRYCKLTLSGTIEPTDEALLRSAFDDPSFSAPKGGGELAPFV
jgi:hypothetical protein